MAEPPPFVGRANELNALVQALRDRTVVVVRGAMGAGKTRLAHHLAAHGLAADGGGPVASRSLAIAHVRCERGDRGVAIRARAERAMDLVPGDLAEALHREPRLLVIDDLHHLAEDDAARLLADLTPAGLDEPRGRLLLLTADMPPMRRDAHPFVMELAGLDETAARDLWHHLEATYGPTRHSACDLALTRTRGLPLALRREYARAAIGDDAWNVAALPAPARQAIEAVAVLRQPAAPAMVAALAPDIAAEAALIDLVSRQLIDPTRSGCFRIHDAVRDQVLTAMDDACRRRLERAAAALLSTARARSWEAGDDSALGPLDPVDRMREEARHLIAAGDLAEAAQRLAAHGRAMARRGGSGEVLGLIEILQEHGEGQGATALQPILNALGADIAVRQGRVARAVELGASADPVTRATLCFRAGDAEGARHSLDALTRAEDPELRCHAAAALVELELARGDVDAAERVAVSAFERDRAVVRERTRAVLHLALAAVEEHAGRLDAARAALTRAASSGRLGPELTALVEARQAMCLAREGRLAEAEAALAEAECAAREVDAALVADEVRLCRSLVAVHRGELQQASETLRALLVARRQRGDEIGALRAELELGRVLLRRGKILRAAEIAAACRASALRRGLRGLVLAAELIDAAIDAAEMRLDRARDRLQAIADDRAADAELRAEAAQLLGVVRAQAAARHTSDAALAPTEIAGMRDELAAMLARAHLALACGDSSAALDGAREVAVRAERAGRRAEVADALALVARLALGRGDRRGAAAAAARAESEARAAGLDGARAGALLVLAALAQELGNTAEAAAHARAAMELAEAAGLSIERLVAAEAASAITGQGNPRAASATMTPAAIETAARMTADLGLAAARPYCMVSAGGQQTHVADADPERLRMPERSLAIDGVREVILRDGAQIADLRRRSLLKRLLFLFARAPGRTFSKEEIVEQVWHLEYHPLRHDAALFTNIMRVRRLLGEDGADLVRVSDDGYRFIAPGDYLYIEAAAAG